MWPLRWFWGLGWQEKLGFSVFLLICTIVVLAVFGALLNLADSDDDNESREIVQGEPSVSPQATFTPKPTVTLGPSPTRPPTRTPQPTDTPRPTVSPYDLSLISASCNQSAGSFIRCEGFVKNISGQALDNVEVVVTFRANDTPVASDSALIEYRPLLANQESPWTVIATYNPAYTSWRVEFKEFFGGSIPVRDDR